MFEACGLLALQERWGGVRNIAVFIDNTESLPNVLARILDLGVIVSQCTIKCRKKTKPRQSQSRALTQVVQSEKLKLTLEVGDGDLELSPLALSSSCGDIVTSGTVVSSASWNDEGLERIMKSDDRGLFPSDTRRFGLGAASLQLRFLFFTVLSPHPSAEVKNKYKLKDPN